VGDGGPPDQDRVSSYPKSGLGSKLEGCNAADRGVVEKLGLGQYAQRFAENGIDLSDLRHLSDQDLKDIGVLLGHRRRMLAAIAELAGTAPTTPQSVAPPEPKPRDFAERRQLTVMFCDLVGSTALSGRLDPEEMREVIRTYQEACSGPVARYDGLIAKFMGDGILAYFGFPRAHEDDAERAVRAALDIVTAVDRLRAPESLKVRVGVATGLVVVGDLIGGGASQEQAVVGDTPNLAARLQALAEPGTIVVAASTRRLLGDLLGKRYGLAYGASNLFKQFSEPFAEPRILIFASDNLAIHPAFILAYAMVACSPTRQQRRQFHCAASQNIDDKLLKKTDRLVVPVEPLSTRIKHPHQESGAQQGITREFRKSSKTQSVNTDFGESNSQQTATSDSYDSCIFKFDKSGVGRIFVGNRKLRQGRHHGVGATGFQRT
jgi:class 3 adenylate cyclase